MNKRQGRAISRPAPDGATAHPTPSKWPTGHRNTGSPTSGTAALTERNIQEAERNFAGFPTSVRKEYLYWVVSAQRSTSRQERIRTVVDLAAKDQPSRYG